MDEYGPHEEHGPKFMTKLIKRVSKKDKVIDANNQMYPYPVHLFSNNYHLVSYDDDPNSLCRIEPH